MSEAGGRPFDHRAVGAGTLTALRTLAAERPVIVGVDDLQWLDHPTARALGFALRRLGAEPIVLLATRRPDATATTLMLDASLRDREVLGVELGLLSVGALGRLVHERIGIRLPRATLLRVHRVSRGNPLFALELARALSRTDAPVRHDDPLPVPDDLHELLMAQVRNLPAPARRVLLHASLLARPTERTIAEAAGADWDRSVERLLSSGIVQVRDGLLSFTHPLRAAAVAASATSGAAD